MSKTSLNKGVYFSELHLGNIKCFKKPVVLRLTDDETDKWKQWTVILGDNGLGKTTILQSLASLEIISVKNGVGYAFDSLQIYNSVNDLGFISANLQYDNKNLQQTDFDLTIKLIMGGASYGGDFYLGSENRMRFVIFSYGASRVMSNTSLSENITEKNSETLFSSDAKLINAEEWLLQLDYAASKESDVKEYAIKKRDKVKEILIDVLPDVTDIRISNPTKKDLKSYAEFLSSFGWLKIDQLSLGYKTMVAWIVDLAARMYAKYPDSNEPLSEPAIVLVDEIDLHLHPKWQRSIFEYLSQKFPATQFIVTAHSPLIVQAAPKDVNLVVLRKDGDHVVIDQNIENVRQWRIDQILTSDLFGIESSRSPEIETWLDERKALLKRADLTDAEKERLKILNKKAHNLPTAENATDIEAMDVIRKAADYLKSGANI